MDLQTKYTNLCNWLAQNGSWVNPKMGIRNEGINGNGMFALETINDEKLFTISENCYLNSKNSKLELDHRIFDHRHTTVISLLFEMSNTESFWRSYIELLPTLESFSNHPLYLSLNGEFPRISQLVNHHIDGLVNDYNKFLENFNNWRNNSNMLLNLSNSQILHGYLLCISRMWTSVGLVPIADLLQHSNTSNISLIIEDNNSIMISKNEIRTGEAIFDNYLLQDDIMLFINFGFIDKSDLISVGLSFFFEEQSPVITKLVDSFPTNKIFLTSEGVNVNLMRHLRLNLLHVDDLKFFEKFDENAGSNLINFNNEYRALQKLKFRLDNLIPQNDLVLLNDSNYRSENQNSQNISLLLSRLFKIKELTKQFIRKYWSDLIS